MNAAGTPPITPPVLSGALLSGWVLRFPALRSDVAHWLSKQGPLRLADSRSGSGESHPIQCELWQVHQGEIRLGSMGQHSVSALFGAAAGAMFGAAGRRLGAELAERVSRDTATALGTYRECLVSVPGVVFGRDPTRHAFVCCMYADSMIARWADLAFGFGYHKRAARFEVAEPGRWSVFDARGPILSFRQTREGRKKLDEQTLRTLDETASMPLLGRTQSGGFARSWLHRSFADTDELHAVSAVMDVRAELLPAGRRRYELGPPNGDGIAIGFFGMSSSVTYPRSVY